MRFQTERVSQGTKSPARSPLKRVLLGATALLGAATLAALASPLVAESTAGYSDGLYSQIEGVSVPPTIGLAAVVPSNALDTMEVLDAAGNLWIWGYYGNDGGANCTATSSAGQGGGRCGIDYSTGTAFNNHKPNQFKALENIKASAASAYASYAIDEFGNLFGWGQNNGGLYMFGNNFNGTGRIVPQGTTPANATTHWADAIIDTDVTSVATVEYGAAYTKSDGTIWTVGDNALAQRGQGTSANGNAALRVATQVTQWPGGTQPKIKTVFSGYEGYYAVSEDNEVFAWGRSFRMGMGASDEELRAAGCTVVSTVYHDFRCTTPVEIPRLTALAQSEGLDTMGGGYSHGHLLTREQNLYSWGSEENNYSGNDALADTSSNGTLPQLKAADVEAASARFGATEYITTDGTAWAYGNRLWGGAFSLNYGSRTPVNSGHLTGKIWDPAQDQDGRRAVLIGGNKDSATVILDEGTILSWGENGGGAACGGYTGNTCRDVNGNVASVTATGTANGLYVWTPAVVEGIQNIGYYQTVSLNSTPFTGSTVMSGSQLTFTATARNSYANPDTFTVGVDVSELVADVDIDPSSITVTIDENDPIPAQLVDNKIEWTGELPARTMVAINFAGVVKDGTPGGATLTANAYMSVQGKDGSDSDTVNFITTTNADDLQNCDTCVAP